MQNARSLIEGLKKGGFRRTPVRTAMIEYLVIQKKPLSATDLLVKVKRAVPSVDKTTIYREIAFLKAQKILQEIQFGEDKKRFELVSNNHHHHIVCVECETVEDISLEKDLDQEERKIAQLKKFRVLNHSLEFFGLCVNCQS